MKLMTFGISLLLASPFALANYENQFCYSGAKQSLTYLESVSSGTMQFTGSWRSVPAGGVMDGVTSECTGSYSMQYGKYVANGHCKGIGDDESAYFSEFLREGKNGKEKILIATGKFAPQIGIATLFTALGTYPQTPGKIVGCVKTFSRN